ncbi:iron-containing alcohol dehydrogenase [Coprothermobacteraceae bacterium]|nr:iron-containing alcohol dehydrogenase [Coprothermobacteraceae bacterium]
MRNFNFYNPTKILFGLGRVKEIGAEISNAGISKVLLVAGGGSIKQNGVYDAVVLSLKQHGISWVEVWGVRPNPVLSKVREAVAIAKENEVDAVLAVGGGSVIDTSKAIAAGVYVEDIWNTFKGIERIEKALPIYVVLTLSATGSEANPNFVITNEETKEKLGNSSPVLYPRVSIIDPSVQMSLPWYQTACGAADALAHIMESYFTGEGHETALYVDEGLMLSIIDSTDRLLCDPKNLDARANLAWAATLALNGVSSAQLRGDWSSHVIEHAVSAFHPDVAHGAGLAVIYPAWIGHVWMEREAVFHRWAQNIWGSYSMSVALERMRSTFKRWGLPTTLRELGVSKQELPDLAANAASKPLGTVKPLNYDDVMRILEAAF